MKTIIRITSIALVMLICAWCFVGCGSDESKDKGITTAEDAIYKAQTDGVRFCSLENEIASALGFKKYDSPNYGTCSALQNSDGSWDVTLKGTMRGSVDDYNETRKTYKFEANVKIKTDGRMSCSAKKVS